MDSYNGDDRRTRESDPRYLPVNVAKLSNGARFGFFVGIATLMLNIAALVWGAATINAKVDEASDALERLTESHRSLREDFDDERVKNAEFRGMIKSLHGDDLSN